MTEFASANWETDEKIHPGDGYMRYVPDHIEIRTVAPPDSELDAGRCVDIAWCLTFLEPNAGKIARLIAAAPNLLAALEAVERHCVNKAGLQDGEHTLEGQRVREGVRTAIAKARNT